MIKFFRKIRQNMLKENRIGKYLLYAAGEVLLVVIGILIALQLNLMAENHKLDESRDYYYHQIIKDLEKDKIYSRQSISKIDSSLNNYATYIDKYKVPGYSINDVFADLSVLNYESLKLQFKTSTIKTLQNTGDIKLMPPFIRNQLSSFKASQDVLVELCSSNNVGKDDLIVEAAMSGAGIIQRLNNQPELAFLLKIEDKMPDMIIKLDGALAWKEFSDYQSVKGLKKIIQDADILIDLIKIELDK